MSVYEIKQKMEKLERQISEAEKIISTSPQRQLKNLLDLSSEEETIRKYRR